MKTLVLLAFLAVGGGEEILDPGAIVRPAPAWERVPRLGCAVLESPCWLWFYAEEPRPEKVDAEWLLDVLDEAGLLWPECMWGDTGRYLTVPTASASEIKAALASLGADVLRTVRVRIDVTFPDGRAESAVVAARDGHWTGQAASALTRFHADNDVEIACSMSAEGAPSVIADPIVFTVREGLAVDVRPFLLGDGEAVAIQAVVQAGRFEDEVPDTPLASRFHGRLQLPRFRGIVASVSGRVDPGGVLTTSLTNDEGTYVVRLSAIVEGAPGGGRLRRPPANLVWAVGPPLRPFDAEELPVHWRRISGTLIEIHGHSFQPNPADGVVSGSREEVAAAAALGAGDAELRARTTRLELGLLAGEERIGQADLSALDGWTAAARIGRETMIVWDWDVEVGCYNAIGDPLVRPVFDGAHVRLRPTLSPDGRTILLDLAYRRLETSIRPPSPSGMACAGVIHLVRCVEREIETDLVLGDGETARIPVGRASDGRPLILVVCASVAK